MTDFDYTKLGFKSGLEIHQRLKSHKLFCDCSSDMAKTDFSIEAMRKLRATPGELGKIDIAAAFEAAKEQEFIYHGYKDESCLVEWDEEPPHLINQEALNIAIKIAMLLNCNIVKNIQVMRKTVLDGSNTSGFQRTMLIGTDGFIDTSFGKVGIKYMILEEEAAKNLGEEKGRKVWGLNRLGIPLVEIVTDPDMKNPEQVKEVAEKIGLMLRSTGLVLRGLGTIRQDINVSIKKGDRTEIKGVQDIRLVKKVIDSEIQRQLDLIFKKKKIERTVRSALADGSTKFMRPLPGGARLYPETDHPLIILDNKKLAKIKKELPEPLEKKKARLEKLNISKDLVKQILHSTYLEFFEFLVKNYKNVRPSIIAKLLFSIPKEVEKKLGIIKGEFSEEHFLEILELLDKGRVAKESVLDIMVEVAKGNQISKIWKDYKMLSDSEIKKKVEEIKKKNKDAPENKIIGIIMGELRGKADAQKILKIVKSK